MKKSLFLLFIFVLSSSIQAQKISYSFKPLAAEGCNVRYTPNWKDGKPYLLIQVKSDRMLFSESPVVLFKSFEGDTIRLEGVKLDGKTESAGIMIGSMILPATELEARAIFELSSEQVDFFTKGIAKVRIYLTPMNHEREFNKDKIGNKIYKVFIKSKKEDTEF